VSYKKTVALLACTEDWGRMNRLRLNTWGYNVYVFSGENAAKEASKLVGDWLFRVVVAEKPLPAWMDDMNKMPSYIGYFIYSSATGNCERLRETVTAMAKRKRGPKPLQKVCA